MLSTRSPTFKHDTVNSSEGSLLADLQILSIIGPDADAFAQSQFMNDVLALPVGHWHWNGWLAANGRVVALFALLRRAPGDLLLVLPDAPAATIADGLKRFLFRSKVEVRARDDLGAFVEWPSPPSADGHRDALLHGPDGAVGADLSGEGGPRRLWIRPRGDAPIDVDASTRWRDADLRHGLPRWAPGLEHRWTPHMLSLDALKAFSTKKGCYPGQEIVARTHFIGQSKRRAWWIEGDGLAAGMAVEDAEGRPVGDLVAVTGDGRGALAVAALPGPGTARVEGRIVQVSPTLTGLARPN